MPNSPALFSVSEAAKVAGFSRTGFYYYLKSKGISPRYINGGIPVMTAQQVQQAALYRSASKRARSKTADPEWVSIRLATS